MSDLLWVHVTHNNIHDSVWAWTSGVVNYRSQKFLDQVLHCNLTRFCQNERPGLEAIPRAHGNAARVSRPFLPSFFPPEKRSGPQTTQVLYINAILRLNDFSSHCEALPTVSELTFTVTIRHKNDITQTSPAWSSGSAQLNLTLQTLQIATVLPRSIAAQICREAVQCSACYS